MIGIGTSVQTGATGTSSSVTHGGIVIAYYTLCKICFARN